MFAFLNDAAFLQEVRRAFQEFSYIQKLLETFVQFGIPVEVFQGTDCLPQPFEFSNEKSRVFSLLDRNVEVREFWFVQLPIRGQP
ncbi:MAG: hypothetical protein WA830_18055 [Candidatus Sulfotelmatobacter sp.]